MDPERIAGTFGVTEGMRVADFGSGAGYFTILLARLVGEDGVVTAVDVLDSALDTVRAKAAGEGLNNVQIIRSNLEILGSSGLADGSQDMLLLANILFQNKDKEAIVNEARRALKSGGRLVVIDWQKGTSGFGPPDELRSDPQTMQAMISQAGFDFVGLIDAGLFHFGMTFKKT